MGRPKKISDSEILLIAFEVISREGFESFTFEQVSKATKLSPAALVKRFKTKKRLAFLARNQKWDANMLQMHSLAQKDLTGLSGIYEFVRIISRSVDSKRLGEHLRMLGTEAEDFKVRKKVAAYFAETRGIFRRLLEEAIANKELKAGINTLDMSMTLEALVQGAIFQFGFLNEKNIERHLKERVESLMKLLVTRA